jgi:hypothetical protein
VNCQHIRETKSSSLRFEHQEWSSQTDERRSSVLGGAFPNLGLLGAGEYRLSPEISDISPVTAKCFPNAELIIQTDPLRLFMRFDPHLQTITEAPISAHASGEGVRRECW